jgi:hypothetical protein
MQMEVQQLLRHFMQPLAGTSPLWLGKNLALKTAAAPMTPPD